MQKKVKKKLTLCFLITLVAAFIFTLNGCVYLEKVKKWNETPPIMEVSEETVRQIDAKEFKVAENQEPVIAETPAPELPEIQLSIEECRALTLENNLDLRVQRINPTLDKELVKQAEAKFEPSFTGTLRYSKSDTPTASALEGSKSDSGSINMSVNVPLRTGGTLSFGMTDYRNKTNSTWSLMNPSYTTDFKASISHELLRNAGKNANTHSIRVARYDSRMSDTRTKLQAMQIVSNVDRAYWLLYARRKVLEVRKQQLDLAEALYEQTKRFVEVGVRPKIELIRTKSEMASKREAIILAENDVRDSERSLKRTLNKKGLGMETSTIIIPSTLPDPVRYDLDRKLLVKEAIENRMELLELELRLAQDDLNIENYKNQALPSMTFQYDYNVNGLGRQRDDSYDLLTDNEYNDHTFNLRFTLPVGNKAAKSKVRRAIYARAQRLTTKESKEAEITNDVLNQIDQVEANWQRILASRESTILRDEQYKAEKRQFELGLSVSYDVFVAQTNLADAQYTEIRAITDYQISLIELARATGTLLGASKVEWEPIVP